MKKLCILMLALAMCLSAWAEAVPVELASFLGGDMVRLREAVPDLERYEKGEDVLYYDPELALWVTVDEDGFSLTVISFRVTDSAYTLCGVSAGMPRETVESRLADEGIAYGYLDNGMLYADSTDSRDYWLAVRFDGDTVEAVSAGTNK